MKEERRKAGLGLGQVKVSHEKLTIQAVWALEACFLSRHYLPLVFFGAIGVWKHNPNLELWLCHLPAGWFGHIQESLRLVRLDYLLHVIQEPTRRGVFGD